MATLNLDLPAGISEHDARLLLAFKLLETQRISLEKAAEVAGYSIAAFMELAGKHGIPIFDYPIEDLQREMKL